MKKILLVCLISILILFCNTYAQEYTVEENRYDQIFSNLSIFKTCISVCIDDNNIIEQYGNNNCVSGCINDRSCSECMDECYNRYNPSNLYIEEIFQEINTEKQSCFINILEY